MELKPVLNSSDREQFFELETEVYTPYPQHPKTEDPLLRAMVEGSSAFCSHASVLPYLILEGAKVSGRFAFVRDPNLPDHIQIAWFEALPGLQGVCELIISTARKLFPDCRKLVAGLNGHLNYGAGFLLQPFEEVSPFGLPHSPPYYPSYFKGLSEKRMLTYRFHMPEFYAWGKKTREQTDLEGISVRILDQGRFAEEIALYTELNNACFTDHPFWSRRRAEDDLELFESMDEQFQPEYLLFAEVEGKAVGYLYWMPDLNEGSKDHYHSYRYAEIAVLPEHRGLVTLALFLEMLVQVEALGCVWGEGGFIFEQNRASIIMTKRYYQRVYGIIPEPWRYLAVYETGL